MEILHPYPRREKINLAAMGLTVYMCIRKAGGILGSFLFDGNHAYYYDDRCLRGSRPRYGCSCGGASSGTQIDNEGYSTEHCRPIPGTDGQGGDVRSDILMLCCNNWRLHTFLPFWTPAQTCHSVVHECVRIANRWLKETFHNPNLTDPGTTGGESGDLCGFGCK